jgi:hypothetical protein
VEGPYVVVDTNVFVSSLPHAAALKSFEERIRQSAERFAEEQSCTCCRRDEMVRLLLG